MRSLLALAIKEYTPEGKVVWEYKVPGFRGVHEIHVLTTNGKPCGSKR